MYKKIALIFATGFFSLQCLGQPNITTSANKYYTSIMDCDSRLPIAVIYKIGRDTGTAKRYSGYIDDDRLKLKNKGCHPKTDHKFKTYQSVLTSLGLRGTYDVGHLASSNHLDENSESSKLANQFSNLAPQNAIFNRKKGAWYQTESIIECHRDLEELFIVAGTIDDPLTKDRDYFVSTFRQTTPDYWYRIIYWIQSNTYQAWIMPNSKESTKERLVAGEYTVGAEYLDSQLPIELTILKQIKEFNIPIASNRFVETELRGNQLTCRGKKTGMG